MAKTTTKVLHGRQPTIPRPKRPFAVAVYDWWKKVGESQPKCAEMLGVSTRTFQRWLNEQYEPYGLVRKSVAARLRRDGVTVAE